MDENMTNKVKHWLEHIMPLVVNTLIEALPVEKLQKMSQETGVHGPVSVNLEEFHAPVTKINFYLTVVDDSMLLATTSCIDGAAEEPSLSFDMFFPIADFANTITDEAHLAQLADTVFKQYQAANP